MILRSLIALMILVSCIQASQVEQNLLEQVMNKYDARIRPTNDADDLVFVSVGLYLNKLRNIDEVNGTVDIGFWVDMGWKDTRLSWKQSYYKNVNKLVIPTTQIWVPDMMLYTGNGVVEESVGADDRYHAVVDSSGKVSYTYPVNRVIQCLSLTEQHVLECNFEIEPWATDKDLMTVTTEAPLVDMSMLEHNLDKAYKIKNATYKVKVHTYPLGSEKYDTVQVRIVLEKW